MSRPKQLTVRLNRAPVKDRALSRNRTPRPVLRTVPSGRETWLTDPSVVLQSCAPTHILIRQPSIPLVQGEPGNLPRNPLKMAIDLLKVEQEALRTYKVQPQVVRLPIPTLVPEVVVRLKVTCVPAPLVSRRQVSFTRRHVPRERVLPLVAISLRMEGIREHMLYRQQDTFSTQRVLSSRVVDLVPRLTHRLKDPMVLRHPLKRHLVALRTWPSLVARAQSRLLGRVDSVPRVMTLVPLHRPPNRQTLVTQQGIKLPHPVPLRKGRKLSSVLLHCFRAHWTQETQQV